MSCFVSTRLSEVEAIGFFDTIFQLFTICVRASMEIHLLMVPLFTPSLVWKGKQKVM